MSKAFWLGVIGGIFGILGALFAIFIGGVGAELGAEGAESLYAQGGAALLFSVIGMAAGAMSGRRKLRSIAMIVSGVAVLIAISFFGVLTLIFFVIGGILIWRSGDVSASQEGQDVPA